MPTRKGKVTGVDVYQGDRYLIDYKDDASPQDDPDEGKHVLLISREKILSEAFLKSAVGKTITVETDDQRKIQQIKIASTVIFKS